MRQSFRKPAWVLLASLMACGDPPEDTLVDDTTPVVVETDTPEVVDDCPTVPDENACEENVLVVCRQGHPKRIDCDVQECGLGEDGVYACLERTLDDNPVPNDLSDMAEVLGGTLSTNGSGLAAFTVDATGLTSFLIQGNVATGLYVWLAELRDPNNRVIRLDAPMLNTSTYAGPDVTLAWPSRLEDGPLLDGPYTITLQVASQNGFGVRNEPVDVTVLNKTDDDLDAGQVHVAVVYPGITNIPADLDQGVSLAVDGWRGIYARYGLELVVEYYTAASFDAVMPAPGGGGDYYTGLTAATENTDIVVIMGEDFTADVGGDVLGQAGNIPGTPTTGPRAVIGVSWLRHAGVNGRFSGDEVSSLATTLAHEVGHFAGLFHPVETTWANFDPLGDTRECDGDAQCYNRLGANLMFPISTCFAAGCEDDVEITPDQVGVLQLYPGTL